MPKFAHDLHEQLAAQLPNASASQPPRIFYMSTPHPHPHCTQADRTQTPETPASHEAVWRSVRTGEGRFKGPKYANYHETIAKLWLWERYRAYDDFALEQFQSALGEVTRLALGDLALYRTDLHMR